MFVRNQATGEVAVYSGGVLSGVDPAQGQAAHGGAMLTVAPNIWATLQAKSRSIENVDRNFLLLLAKVDVMLTRLEQILAKMPDPQ